MHGDDETDIVAANLDDDAVEELREWFMLAKKDVTAALAILESMNQRELPKETRYALTLMRRKLELARWRLANHPLRDING